MYVESFENDFYELLTGKRVVLLVHYDIDAICACKILQQLLQLKEILYTLSIVQGVEDLKVAFQENCESVKYFVLINCGSTVNLVDLCEPDEDVVFFVIDSHRPTHVDNIYSTGQVRLLWGSDDDFDVPEFNDIYRDDSEDEEEKDQEEDGSGGEEQRDAKRRRLDEDALMKRRERRLWEEKRFDILSEYSQYTYHAKASASFLLNFAWQLGKIDNDLLWLSIIAVTEQHLLGKIENSQYMIISEELQAHALRLKHSVHDIDTTTLKISYEKDLKLVLYRHWSVESSLKYSMFTACKMKLWTHKGSKKLYELLAEMGLPLSQSKQMYESMDLQLRKEFLGSLDKLTEKYHLDDLVFGSFVLQYGYRNKYAASDIVYALLALLDCSKTKPEEAFNLALDCFSKNRKNILDQAIERAKLTAKTIFKTVKGAVDMKQVITAGNFVYYIIQEGNLDWQLYRNPHILLLLAQFILRGYVTMSRNRRAPDLPLIISVPKNLELGTCLVLGIPPLRQISPKNNLGHAFEEAAENINYDALSDYFDTSYFEIFIKDRTRFFDALTALFDK